MSFFRIRADPDEFSALEEDRVAEGAADFQEDQRATVNFDRMETEVDLGLKEPQKPVLKFLAANLSFARLDVVPTTSCVASSIPQRM